MALVALLTVALLASVRTFARSRPRPTSRACSGTPSSWSLRSGPGAGRARPTSHESGDHRPPQVHDNRNSSDALAVQKPTDMSETAERSIDGEWTRSDTVSESTNPDRLAFRSPAQQRWMTRADPTCSRRWLILAVVGVPRAMVVLDTTRRRRMRPCRKKTDP
jgi:hypothetical protein